MHFVTTYTFKPFTTDEETRKVLAIFAEVGNAPGVTHHFVFTDGSGGVVFGESDDVEGLYRNVLAYGEFIQFQTRVALPVEVAAPLVAESVTP